MFGNAGRQASKPVALATPNGPICGVPKRRENQRRRKVSSLVRTVRSVCFVLVAKSLSVGWVRFLKLSFGQAPCCRSHGLHILCSLATGSLLVLQFSSLAKSFRALYACFSNFPVSRDSSFSDSPRFQNPEPRSSGLLVFPINFCPLLASLLSSCVISSPPVGGQGETSIESIACEGQGGTHATPPSRKSIPLQQEPHKECKQPGSPAESTHSRREIRRYKRR